MNTQRSISAKKLTIQKNFNKASSHLLHHRKISNLQSKAIFFQGQVDPLHTENISLKEQLIALTKIVIDSTELLRNLLPINDNPSKKLKLQMANLTEISEMIKHDWLEMEQTITRNIITIETLEIERNQWHLKFDEEHLLRLNQINQLENNKAKMKYDFQNTIKGLKNDIILLIEEQKLEKQQMKEDFKKRLNIYDSTLKEYDLFKYQTKLKERDYEKAIQRLKGQIQANYQSFEQSKKNLKQIYDKIMTEKLAEQAQGYEMMLKMKDDEKISLMIQIGQTQQENKRKFALKQYEIAKLNELKTAFQEEIGQLKSQVWSKQICIDKQVDDLKHMEKQIEKANKAYLALQNEIDDKEEAYKLQKISLEQKIKKHKNEIDAMRRDGSNALKKILEERQKLQKQLEQTTEKNKQLSSSLSKAQAQFNSKLAKLTEKWQKQAEELKLQIEKGKKQLDEKSDALKLSQLQKDNLIRLHVEDVKKLKKTYQQKQEQLISGYQKKIATLQFDSQQAMKEIKRKHEQILREANIAANEELRQIMMECNLKLTIQAQQMHKQLEAIRKEGIQMRTLLEKAQQEILNQKNQVERIKYEHKKEIQKINEQNELQKQKLNDQLDKQIKQFQRSLEEKEAELSNMRADMENQIKLLKEANSIDTIEQRYQQQMNKLKEQFQDKVKLIQENNNKKIESLTKQHREEIDHLNKMHQNDLSHIAEKTQNEVTFLNDRIMNGLSDFSLDNLTADQKKQYIINKVSDLKTVTAEKEIKIVKLQNSLADMEKNLQKRIKARRDQLQLQKQLVVKNCDKKINLLQSECASKVLAAERQKIRHTQIMYQEFEALRQQHQLDRLSLQKKYFQLEKLFEERPSRAEDLTKIKELINMQTKMDIEIQSYQKKMETANEIVKYLNLQLQNYKDTYDIFGPNSDNKEGGLVGLALKLKEQFSNHNSHNQSQNIIDVIRARRHQRYHSEGKFNTEISVTKEDSVFQKWTNSPAIKEIKLFEQEQSRFVTPSPDGKNSQFLRYSNLMREKSIQKRQKFKTERSQPLDNEAEILSNAQHFIRLIKQNKSQHPVIKEEDQFSRRKSYRKRKLGRKRPTAGIQNYF